MAQQPDGKAARVEKVAFTKDAAARIAKVVRAVEAGNRDCGPLTFDRVGIGGSPYKLSLATFTGNWQTGHPKIVTISGSTQTASVYNWCSPVTGADTSNTTETRYVIFGRVSGTNSAVEIEMFPKRTQTECTATMTLGSVDLSKLPGYSSGSIQMLGHGASDTASTCVGGLQWYSITTCSTSTAS